MQNIIGLQIIVYLLVSPLVVNFFGLNQAFNFTISVVFLLSFGLGVFAYSTFIKKNLVCANLECKIVLSKFLKIIVILGAICYIVVVLRNDLLYRRIGSHEAAGLYSAMALGDKAVLRGFEILFYPILVLLLKSLKCDSGVWLKLAILSQAVGFCFTGVADSRAKILMPGIYLYIYFVQTNDLLFSRYRKFWICIGVFFIFGSIVVGSNRIDYFNNGSEFFISEILVRVNGIELISAIDKEVQVPAFGTFDLAVFDNFVSAIPFLDSSKVLKEAGMTSSKNYYLKNILETQLLDFNNSIVTDLFYFSGYLGIIVGGAGWGFIAKKIDVYLVTGKAWLNRITTAWVFSISINALKIEVDFFGMIISSVRDFIIIYVFLMMVKFNQTQRERR